MEVIAQLIASVGFPIAMCLLMGYWIKTTHDDHRDDIKRLQDGHSEETKEMTEAINNNTIVLQKLVDKIADKIGDDNND